MSEDTRWLAETLLPWFDTHGRHDLPWQADPTPYRVWVSEVMLQQTQVDTVRPYFERFVARFPDAVALAAAAPDAVMGLWSGLGYYARARNLHRAAKDIVSRHGGELPDSLEVLMALPGIGRSTAGAILALAHGIRQPILDGNVKRVLARAFLVEEAPDSSAGLRKLWALAEACTPDERVAAYTQAIMDLGATLCTRAQPACTRCPLASRCAALAMGRTTTLPAPKRRAPRRERSAHFVFVLDGGQVLLQRRPPRGIWGGLWVPPEFPDEATARAYLSSRHRAIEPTRVLAPLRHAFTHFDLVIQPWVLDVQVAPGLAEDGEARWHELAALDGVGVPAPVARLLEELKDGANGPLREARSRGGRPREAAVPG
jgi:A/G-specific adenine glycosylase